MLHFAHHWPAKTNFRFWPQAIDYALWVFNRLPNLTNGLSPNELWSSCGAPNEEFHQSHVFGCPVYVLDATLQDGHKLPKWAPWAHLGVFLGFSTLHSSQVPLVMNVDTGKISPQFHVIFDDKFETVLSMASDKSIGDQWKSIVHLKRECFEGVEFDENGNAITPPLTSIFQQDDVVTKILPTSKWNSDPNILIPQMSPTPLHSEFKVKAAPTGEPNGEPTGDPSVKPTMTIVARDDISNNGSQLLQDSEGALQQADSASEGAPQGTLVPIDCSIDTNIAPEVPIQKWTLQNWSATAQCW
jgi:hypothetical protein